MTSSKRTEYIVFFTAVLARVVFFALTKFTADDAFITFRYAENIAGGLGFVYNEGERVLGTTTPLFTLILATFSLMRVSVMHAALFVSLIASGVTAVLVYRLARSLRFGGFELLPVIAYILWPRSLPVDIGGMETAFFTMLVTAAFYFQHRRLEIYAIGMATLASVTRPEGYGLLVLLLAYNLITRRHEWKQLLAVPLVLLLPWLAFATIYFGSPIPNSVYAKLGLYSRFGQMSYGEAAANLLGVHTILGWPIIPAVLLGGWWLFKKQNYGQLEAIWLIAMFAFFTFSQTMIFTWYIVPVYPILLLFACAVFPFAASRLHVSVERMRLLAVVALAAAAITLLALDIKPVRFYISYEQLLSTTHKAIGEYLYTHSEKKDVVAAEDIGYMGYYSHRRILDRDGLVSPEAVPYNRAGRYLNLLIDFNTQWVVAALNGYSNSVITDSLFLARYRQVAEFGRPDIEYLLFHQIDSVAVPRQEGS